MVAAANGACANLVRDAEAGLTVLPDNAGALADGVLQMYSLPDSSRRIMGEKGRAYLLSHFAKEKVIRNYESVLLAVAQGVGEDRSAS